MTLTLVGPLGVQHSDFFFAAVVIVTYVPDVFVLENLWGGGWGRGRAGTAHGCPATTPRY